MDADVDAPIADTSAAGRVEIGLVGLYNFDEGSGTTLNDLSLFDLDLTLSSAASFDWTTSGLRLNDLAGSVTSNGPATVVTSAIVSASEFTFEVWAVPSLVAQPGPARIMAISENPNNSSNAALLHGDGDGGLPCDPGFETNSAFQLRTRTSGTGPLGCPGLLTPLGAATQSLLHLVATRTSSGTRTLYVNGAEVSTDVSSGNLLGWSIDAPLVLFNVPTGDRGWLGELQLAAIYARALTATEVATNFAAGPN